ncbi:DNL zinc finger protein [Amylocarpus encephaloides]|uniref:DNL zinc finger protein n=1 Tax=Amylocarpus encephaloides TaxID=45428 RepID=A0A9P8C8K6_9HELO|nr:DNL zinc finger protein [Amylocarpus encephaloides]
MPPFNPIPILQAVTRWNAAVPRALPMRNAFQPFFSTPYSNFRASVGSLEESSSPIPNPQSPPPPKTKGHSPRSIIPPPPPLPKPEYQMAFTCTPCGTRSTHRVSKQGYHKGSVLITCPECRNRHIISDHLKIFGDKNITIEDLMREKGQIVKKGTLSEDGDVEFWEDGTSTPHVKAGETKGTKEIGEPNPEDNDLARGGR